MANTRSAKKAIRKIERRERVNRARRSRMRTCVREVEEAIAAGNQEAANAALAKAEPEIARTAARGVIHKSTAARKVSRLSARVRGMGA
jgi:small subunit ribosomal protein S20